MAAEISLMQSPAIQQLPLKDLHLPAEPGFWPPAPGWWLVAVIGLALLIWSVSKYIQYRRKRQQWRRLEQLWQAINDDYKSHQNKSRLARQLSSLLRRYVRHRQTASAAAELSGSEWIAFLNKDLKHPLFNDFSDTLSRDLYQPHSDFKASQLLEAVHIYLKHHSFHTRKNQSAKSQSARRPT